MPPADRSGGGPAPADERLRRWRLAIGDTGDPSAARLSLEETAMDRALAALYGGAEEGGRGGNLASSAPYVARWLGDVRRYFPSSVAQVLQKDAIDRFGVRRMLAAPEILEAVEPDVHLVASLVALSQVLPQQTRETARGVVRKVVADLERRLRNRTTAAVRGSLDRATRSRRPRPADIDFDRTIRANLRNWDPARRTVVAERLVGRGRRATALRDVVLCVDQSGSMAPSVVYASVFAAVLASLRSLSTRMVFFDTAVADLSAELHDPVDLLFGAQLGGGTDIGRALAYCRGIVTRPSRTVLVLISDLCEGGDPEPMHRHAAALVASGVQVVCLLALADSGAPAHDPQHATRLAALGVPCFACTPDVFPELMAAALARRDLGAWAASRGIETQRGG